MKSVQMEQFIDLPEGTKFFFVRYDRIRPHGSRRCCSWRDVYVKNFKGAAMTTDGQELAMPVADDDLVIRIHSDDESQEPPEGVTIVW